MSIRYLRHLGDLISRGINNVIERGPDRTFLLLVRYVSWKLRFQNRISRLPPRANLAVTRIVLAWVRVSIKTLRYLFPNKYTDADPYAVRHVKTDKITHVSNLEGTKRRGWVMDGNWDQNVDRFLDRPIPNSIEQHFSNGVNWEETALADEYDDTEQFQQKCEYIEQLHEQIVTQGFQCQRELLITDPEAAWSGVNTTISPVTNEITVDVGRNGEVLFNMLGKHRLSIAKVTGVEKVPVMVSCRHTDWQRIRELDQYENAEGKEGHPDLIDLYNESQAPSQT